MPQSDLAQLYALLAETLAEPPDWMSLPGCEWPLFDLLTQLAAESDLARRHLDLLAGIPSEVLDQRRERYSTIFASGRPRFWLYESAAKTGKILGPQAFEMARLYHAVGLEASGAELPNHISLELTFLSYLANQDESLTYERQFLERHGTWMIDLGRALERSDDLVYAPIGALLADRLTEQMQTATRNLQPARNSNLLPNISEPNDCTLCGFCAQVCQTRALKVLEDRQQTILALSPAECTHCGKCEKVCDFKVLKMISVQSGEKSLILRHSPLVSCKKCERPIASQAEMNYIVSQIGDAAWQHLCLDCRATLFV